MEASDRLELLRVITSLEGLKWTLKAGEPITYGDLESVIDRIQNLIER